jgi:hypothetical protein
MNEYRGTNEMRHPWFLGNRNYGIKGGILIPNLPAWMFKNLGDLSPDPKEDDGGNDRVLVPA